MSYILEALKKSQQERQIGHVPDISQLQDVPLSRPTPRWPRWLLAALLLNAVILVVLAWRNWEAHMATGSSPTPVAVAPPVVSPAVSPVPEPRLETPAVPPALPEAALSHPETLPEPVTQLPAAAPASEAELAAEPALEAEPLPPIEPAPGVAEVAPESSAELPPRWQDLPLEERTGLPAPRIDVHVFAQEPERRFVLINLRKYQVGDTLDEGATLDAILADGIVLSYGGRQYRVDRP
ncbi:MAG: general secretion pathway protein GspB [Gammaproteobacteria bacterium]|nr:general secretion pathway protein GspB [Gammaproteobacteria bacterium]